MSFADRVEAGRRLARLLGHLRGQDVVVLGLPRGGVPVAFEVAQALDAPLDVIVVRKLGVPSQPELAMGAVGEEGTRVLNSEVLAMARISDAELAAVERAERAELDRRVRQFRGERSRESLAGRVAVVVDDGVATGATARAACQVARVHGASRVVLAVPVASPREAEALKRVADEVVCVETPTWLSSIGQWYDDFAQTTDAEVVDLLARAADRTASRARDTAAAPAGHRGHDGEVVLKAGPVQLAGRLTIPPDAGGLVVFAHGSGSSRHSPRNRYVADVLHGAGLGTLLFDLLTTEEESVRRNVFDIDLLTARLVDVVGWLRGRPEGAATPIGLFGASTGAAAALSAAAEPGIDIAAVVSRGGRPDLAGDKLAQVEAPTLLIVGALDDVVLDLNRAAQAELRGVSQLAVVPGASHLFEEPGTLQIAAELARDWFQQYLGAPDRHAGM